MARAPRGDRETDKVTVFVSDVGAWDEVNAAYAEFFGTQSAMRVSVTGAAAAALNFGVQGHRDQAIAVTP